MSEIESYKQRDELIRQNKTIILWLEAIFQELSKAKESEIEEVEEDEDDFVEEKEVEPVPRLTRELIEEFPPVKEKPVVKPVVKKKEEPIPEPEEEKEVDAVEEELDDLEEESEVELEPPAEEPEPEEDKPQLERPRAGVKTVTKATTASGFPKKIDYKPRAQFVDADDLTEEELDALRK